MTVKLMLFSLVSLSSPQEHMIYVPDHIIKSYGIIYHNDAKMHLEYDLYHPDDVQKKIGQLIRDKCLVEGMCNNRMILDNGLNIVQYFAELLEQGNDKVN